MPAAAEKPKNETTYIVGTVGKDGSSMVIVGDVLANGPEQAVRRVAPDKTGVFVAVPARNWTIVGQQSETPPPVITQTVRKWGDGLPEEALAATETLPIPETIDEPTESRRVSVVPDPPAHPADEIEDDGA